MMAAKLAVLYENAVLYDVIQRHAAQLQVEISERRRAEQAVRESEAKFRELIEQASDGIFVTDAQGSFKLVNPRFCEMLGYSEDALLRLGAGDTYAEEEKTLFTRRLADLGEVKSRLFERMMRRKDGTLFPVEMSVRRLSNGMNQGIVRDITERRTRQQALAESEFRFRQLTENITEVFWLTDPSQSEMLYISPSYAKIWGRSCQVLYASPRDWIDAIHPEDRQRVLEAAVAKQARGDYDEEYRIVRPDGSARWIRDRAFPVPDPEGRPYRIAGVAEDVTEHKRAADEQKQAEDKIRRLNRVYAVLSGINTLIVRVRDRDELFRESCIIAVEAGQFPMAWIGLVDRETSRVKPVAWGGGAEKFLASAPLSMSANRAAGRGMSGRAISEKKARIANDIQSDSRTQMKVQCRERGINSLVFLPLIVGDEGIGVLALYARAAGFFDEEEMKLLRELAGDISFAP